MSTSMPEAERKPVENLDDFGYNFTKTSRKKRLLPFILYMMFNGSSGYAFFAFSPILFKQYVSEGQVSLILLFQPLLIMFLSPIFGRISDQRRIRKKLVVVGFIVKLGMYTLLQLVIFLDLASLQIFVLCSAIRGLSLSLATCENAWFSDFTYDLEKKLQAISTSGITGDGDDKTHTGISFYFLVTSISWAAGSVGIGFLIDAFSVYNLGFISLLIASIGLVPLLLIEERYADSLKALESRIPMGKPKFNIIQDIKDLDQGVLIYPAIMLRHFGLITTLSLLAIITSDLGLGSSVSGIILSLNPLFQIFGMGLATFLLVKMHVKPLRLLSTGILLSTLVVLSFTMANALYNGAFLVIGQIMLGFGWPVLIIGVDEYIIKNVDWQKRANYITIRAVFMNLGKVLGQFMYFFAYEALMLDRLMIFTILVFFPLTGFVLSIIAAYKRKKNLKLLKSRSSMRNDDRPLPSS
ncbi:MAG: MFS transporter [Promethearchaeota archaeon]